MQLFWWADYGLWAAYTSVVDFIWPAKAQKNIVFFKTLLKTFGILWLDVGENSNLF